MNKKILKVAVVLLSCMLIGANAVAAPGKTKAHAPQRMAQRMPAPSKKPPRAPSHGAPARHAPSRVMRAPTPPPPAHGGHHHRHHRHHGRGDSTLHSEDWIAIGVGLIGGLLGVASGM